MAAYPKPSEAANLLFLANWDGTDGDTAYTDESVTPLPITFEGVSELTDANSRFGPTHLLAGPGDNDRFSLAIDASDLQSGPDGDFTITSFFRNTTVGSRDTFFEMSGSLELSHSIGGLLRLIYTPVGGSQTIVNASPSVNNAPEASDEWGFFAVQKQGNKLVGWIGRREASPYDADATKVFDITLSDDIDTSGSTLLWGDDGSFEFDATQIALEALYPTEPATIPFPTEAPDADFSSVPSQSIRIYFAGG